MSPFTLSVVSPYAFDVRCPNELALAVAHLGWLIGRERWGYC